MARDRAVSGSKVVSVVPVNSWWLTAKSTAPAYQASGAKSAKLRLLSAISTVQLSSSST